MTDSMSLATLQHHLDRLGACWDAGHWVRWKRDSPAALWSACERGDWQLWLAARTGIDRRLIVLVICDCARTALGYVPAGEGRTFPALEVAERWTRGEATAAEVRAVSAGATSADRAGADRAAFATCDVAAAAANGDAFPHTADIAVCATICDADRENSLRRIAELVRTRISWATVADALAREDPMICRCPTCSGLGPPEVHACDPQELHPCQHCVATADELTRWRQRRRDLRRERLLRCFARARGPPPPA